MQIPFITSEERRSYLMLVFSCEAGLNSGYILVTLVSWHSSFLKQLGFTFENRKKLLDWMFTA